MFCDSRFREAGIEMAPGLLGRGPHMGARSRRELGGFLGHGATERGLDSWWIAIRRQPTASC
jgi:hypothetical protein